MRALITGVGGFVGSHLIEYLLENTDWDIWGFMKWTTSTDNLQSVIDRANREDRVHFLYGDLRDPWSVMDAVRTSRPDYVFHLAAQSFPKVSFTSPNDTLETNIQGTVNVLEALKDYDAQIHICSSSEVYGRVKPENIPIDENCPFAPASPYSIGKVGTDLLGKLYADSYGMSIMITRMFTHTGARRGDVFAESTFAKQIAMIEVGQMEPPIKVGNLNSTRTVTDVHDAVRAYHMLLTVAPQPGEVYNIGSNFSISVGGMLKTLLTLAEKDYEVEVDESRLRPVDADLQIPNCEKFMSHTGWKPEIPFDETMWSLLAYWREQVKLKRHLIR